MPLVTPEEWLPYLAQKLDDERPVVASLRRYVNGNAPLPEMGKNTRASWEAFQKKARVNYGGVACVSHANRIVLSGVRVGDDHESDATLAARRIYRDNRLPMQVADAVWDMLAARRGYLVAGVDEDGRALITAEKPEWFYAEADPTRPWRSRAALKVWRDDVEKLDYALVWVRGSRATFARSTSEYAPLTATGTGWALLRVDEYDGHPPVWILDRRTGQALVEPHTDLIDQINEGKLQRLTTAAIQAFKQRALKKQPGASLPDTDAEGNPVDWEKVFEPAPGALWDLPEGIDIWESAPTDLRMLLDGEKADQRTFAGVTGTPISALMPDGQNQSAAGANATTAQQVDACRTDIERIKLAVAAAMVAALRIEGVDFGDETVEVDFLDPAWTTLAEQMDAVSKATSAGMSLPMAQKMFLGWTQDQIDEDERNRRRAAGGGILDRVLAARTAQPVAVGATEQQ